jgi:hypothetical protein
MNSPLLLLILLALATGIGMRLKATQGRIKQKKGLQISASEIGGKAIKAFIVPGAF